jgi:hypothetical protein
MRSGNGRGKDADRLTVKCYWNHEYWCPRSAKVGSVVMGLCLFIAGAYFGSHFAGRSNEANVVYRKALADQEATLMLMHDADDKAYQDLFREYNQINEVAKNAVEQRNRFGSTANHLALLSFFGGCVGLVPALFWLIRLPRKFYDRARLRAVSDRRRSALRR